MIKQNSVYALEMLQLIDNVRKFVGDISREEFVADHKTAASALLEIMMLGEIAKRVPEDMKNAVAIPWKDIAGFRDRAIHDYSKIDMDIVAGIVFDRLSEVENALRVYLGEVA